MSRKDFTVNQEKQTATDRETISLSAVQSYVDELYDHGLQPDEVADVLQGVKSKRRVNPKGKDFDNEYVWNTSDRLDRALTLAARRLTMVKDYQKRLEELQVLLESVRLQIGLYGDSDKARVLLGATKAYMAQPVTPWAEASLTTDWILCSICRCELCVAKIDGIGAECCDHRDDTGSWGLPF